MKSFGVKPWMLPQPVLIIGTYNEDGTSNAMNAAWGGQWDRGEIMVSMGAHATTENLARCADFSIAFATKETMVASDFVGIVSAKNDPDKIDESDEGYYIVAEVVNILVDEKYLTEEGQPDVQKMGLITYEPVSHSYVALGDTVGKAFSDGKKLK